MTASDLPKYLAEIILFDKHGYAMDSLWGVNTGAACMGDEQQLLVIILDSTESIMDTQKCELDQEQSSQNLDGCDQWAICE